MIAWFMKVLRQWNDFKGRARRSEYWYFTLVYLLIYIPLYVLVAIAGSALGDFGHIIALVLSLALLVFALALLIPSIAVGIRRLHDTGRSGWWLLLGLVPFGGFVLLYFFVLDSDPNPNQYGPSPKSLVATI